MMLARVVLSRRVAVLAAQAGRSVHLNRQFNFTYVKYVPNPTLRVCTRFYSTPKDNQNQNETNNKPTEENKPEEELNKEEDEGKEKEEKEGKEGKEEKETEEERKEDDTPIVEPEWRAARQSTFQKPPPSQQETKIPKSVAYLCAIIGTGALVITGWELYKTVTTAQKENTADPNLLYRKVLDESIKAITENQKTIDKFIRIPSIIEESMVQCQAFGKVTSISYPLLQPTTAARVGTVYIDIERVEDTFHLRSAYVDFVVGKSLDLVEVNIIKPADYKFFLFAKEFSVEESLKQMYEESQRMAAQAQQQQQQQPQRQ